MCKLNHDDGDGIPKFLCRACNPEAFANAPVVNVAPVIESPYMTDDLRKKMRTRALRPLRAEEKRLRKLADDIGRTNPPALARVYDALKTVEREIRAKGGE